MPCHLHCQCNLLVLLSQAGAPTESLQSLLFSVAAEGARENRPRNALIGAMPRNGPSPTAALFEAAAAGHVGCVQALLQGKHASVLVWGG